MNIFKFFGLLLLTFGIVGLVITLLKLVFNFEFFGVNEAGPWTVVVISVVFLGIGGFLYSHSKKHNLIQDQNRVSKREAHKDHEENH